MLLGVREQLLQVCRGSFGSRYTLVTKVEALVPVAVDQHGYFGEMALLPLVAREVANDVAVDTWPVVEVSKAINALRLRVVGVDVCLLARNLQC